jgi:ubiquinol oxidase
MPYFSYIAMLHLYETLGFWRRSADVKRIHFAEELNEYRHLLIMESLGGDQAWWVRFVAQHSAMVYFYVLCLLFALSPTLSYRFSELLETHAVNTYGVFLDDNEEMLKKMPPPMAAVEYYTLGAADPFYAEFQTAALASGLEVSLLEIVVARSTDWPRSGSLGLYLTRSALSILPDTPARREDDEFV